MILTAEDYQTIIDLSNMSGLVELNGTDLASLVIKLRWLLENTDFEGG